MLFLSHGWYKICDYWYHFFTHCEELVPIYHANHEDLDTRMVLHALDERIADNVVTQTWDTGVFILLLYHLGDCSIGVWMLSETTRVKMLKNVD